MADRISFVVNGRSVTLSRQEVERRMESVAPEAIRSHVVVIADVRYPVKQVFAMVTGLDRLDFTSATARRLLAKLGFELARDES